MKSVEEIHFRFRIAKHRHKGQEYRCYHGSYFFTQDGFERAGASKLRLNSHQNFLIMFTASPTLCWAEQGIKQHQNYFTLVFRETRVSFPEAGDKFWTSHGVPWQHCILGGWGIMPAMGSEPLAPPCFRQGFRKELKWRVKECENMGLQHSENCFLWLSWKTIGSN